MTGIDNLFTGLRSASSGLAAERVRIDVISDNIANANTTHGPGGGAYRRKVVSFEPILQKVEGSSVSGGGVRVSSVATDFVTPLEHIFEPGHPDADADGMVAYPNVNSVREMADLMTAIRAYEANLKAQEVFGRMAQRALDMIR